MSCSLALSLSVHLSRSLALSYSVLPFFLLELGRKIMKISSQTNRPREQQGEKKEGRKGREEAEVVKWSTSKGHLNERTAAKKDKIDEVKAGVRASE